jgi:hypothetical protein
MPVYLDPENFYSITYPAGWKAFQEDGEVQFRPAGDSTRSLSISRHNKVLTVESLVYQIAEDFTHRWPLYLELARSKIDLNGYPAIWVEQSYTIDDFTERGFMLAVVRNRIGFVILGWAPSNDYEEYQPALKSMALTFQLHDDPEAPLYENWPSIRTSHSVLKFLPGSSSAEFAADIASEQEAAIGDVLRMMQLDFHDILVSYFYPSAQSLYRSTACDSEFSIPAAAEIHNIWISPQKHGSTGHALTHVLVYCSLGEAGQPLLGEGLAGFLDRSGKDYHSICRILQTEGLLLPLASLLDNGWTIADSQISYPQAASFTRFLLEVYGNRRFKQLYLRPDFTAALAETLDVSLSAVEKGWQAFLSR